MQCNSADRKSVCLTNLRPIFVIGCCNSGTTLMWKTLLRNPGVSGPDIEGQAIEGLPKYLTHFIGRETFRLFAHPKFHEAYYLTENDTSELARQEVFNVYSKYFIEGTRFIEKSPANSVRMRFLQATFPNAQFVVIIRNGVAVAEGIRRKRWFDPERPHLSGQETTIEQSAEQWLYANKTILNDLAYIKSFRIIRYEKFVENPTAVMNNLYSFLSLPKITIDTSSFRIDDNEKQIARLKESEILSIYSIQGKLLQQLGYRSAFPKQLVDRTNSVSTYSEALA